MIRGLAACIAYLVIAYCDARNYGPTITAPTRFDTGDFMTSNNTQYHAIMQPDGNFIVYNGSLADKPSSARWRTRTNQHSNGPYHIDLQTDNNFMLYDSYQQPLWKAKIKRKGVPPVKVTLEDDGNLIMRDAGGKKLWASKGDLKDVVKVTKKPPKKPKKDNGWGNYNQG